MNNFEIGFFVILQLYIIYRLLNNFFYKKET